MLNRCLFHSLFRCGWGPVGNFEAPRGAKPPTVKQIALVMTTTEATGLTGSNPTTIKSLERATSLQGTASNLIEDCQGHILILAKLWAELTIILQLQILLRIVHESSVNRGQL